MIHIIFTADFELKKQELYRQVPVYYNIFQILLTKYIVMKK